MTLEEMRARKKELGYTYEQISKLSGVPLGTVQKIFSGVTSTPRYDTLLALEQVLAEPDCSYARESQTAYTARCQAVGLCHFQKRRLPAHRLSC